MQDEVERYADGRAAAGRRRAFFRLTVPACAAVLFAVAAPVSGQQGANSNPAFTPLVSIKELMEKTITPTTNTIWNAYEPPIEEEQWTALEEAAVTLLAAANVNGLGGTGPMDDEWVQESSWKAFNQVMISAGQEVVSHNMETVKRLYRHVRPQAKYDRSLEQLRRIKEFGKRTKSGVMLGLGETDDEVYQIMDDLVAQGVDILTLGQYLQPTPMHLEVVEYVTP